MVFIIDTFFVATIFRSEAVHLGSYTISPRGMVLSLKNNFIFVIARSAISSKLSRVAPAQCGESTVFSNSRRDALSGGSFEKVSRPAENNCPSFSAATIAVSSMRPPLAQFMIIAPFFIFFTAFLSIRFLVLAFSGQ